MQTQKYTYDGEFEWNILVVGKTEFGKTYSVLRITANKFFGELKKVEWVS